MAPAPSSQSAVIKPNSSLAYTPRTLFCNPVASKHKVGLGSILLTASSSTMGNDSNEQAKIGYWIKRGT